MPSNSTHLQAARRRLSIPGLLALLGVIGCSLAAAGQEPDEPAGYRRVFVPAEQPGVWPVGPERYLPVDQATLDRLLDARPAGLAVVESIELQAAPSNEGLVVGAGRMRVRVEGGAPAFVPWPNRAMFVRDARWGPPLDRTALVGSWVTGPAGDSMRYGLSAVESGTVLFGFEAAAAPGSSPPAYELPLPAALARRLVLTLPAGVTPIAGAAFVEPLGEGPAAPLGGEDGQEVPTKRWLIRAQSGRPLAFALQSGSGAKPQASAPIYARLNLDATVTLGGVGLVSRCKLRCDASLPDTLSLRHPLDAAVLNAEVDGRAANWRVETDGDPRGNPARLVVVDLGGRQSPREATLALTTWTPLSPRSTWRLSPLSAQGVRFLEGTARLAVDAGVRVVDIPELLRATPILAHREQSATASSTFAYRLLGGDAAIDLRLEPAADPPAVRLRQASKLSEAEVWTKAKLTLPRPAEAGTQPLVFEVDEAWLVESVECDRPEALEDWYTEPASVGARRLVLQPAMNVNASDVFTVTCRRPTPRSQTMPLAGLAPLEPLGRRLIENRLSLSAAAPYGLRLAPLEQAAPRQPVGADGAEPLIEAIDLDLLHLPTAGYLDETTALLRRRPRRYETRIDLRLSATKQGFLYRAAFTVDAPGERPDTLPVYFDPPLPTGARWLEARSNAPVDATRLDEAPRQRSPAGGESWVVRLPAQEGTLARVAVEVLLPPGEAARVPLALATGADSQTGRVTLSGFGIAKHSINAPGLQPQPSGPGKLVYDYNPRGLVDPRRAMRLGVSRPASDRPDVNQPLRMVELQSVWTGDGAVLHTAEYEHRRGLGEASFALPAGIELIAVTDPVGARLAVTNARGANRDAPARFVVTLPDTPPATGAGELSPEWRSFSIAYIESTPIGSRVARAVLPEADTTGAAWRWMLLTPDSWATSGDLAKADTWRRRLLGSLAQQPGEQPFNPLRWQDWWGLARVASAPGETIEQAARRFQSSSFGGDSGRGVLDGWRRSEFTGAATPPASVGLVNLRWRCFVSRAIMLLTMTLAAWTLVGRTAWGVTALGAALTLALVAPTPLAPAASAIWIGLVLAWPFGWIVRWLERRYASQSSAATKDTRWRSAIRSASASAILLSLVLAGTAAGDPPMIEQVLIPVDEDGQPVDDKRYIRDAYLKELLQREQRRKAQGPSDFVIRAAEVSGELVRDQIDSAPRPGRWWLSLDLESLRRNAEVRLPIARDEATWAESASVDGVPAAIKWREGLGAVFTAPDPGPCRVVIGFEPQIVVADGESCLRVSLPRMPGARVEVTHPESLTDLRVPFAETTSRPSAGRTLATLADGGELLVCWTESRTAPTAYRRSVDLLQWLTIDRTGVTAEVRLVAPTTGEAVSLLVPAGWSSLDNPAATRVEIVPYSAGGDATGAGAARFRIDRESPLGVVRAPRIEVAAATVDRRLAAVTLGGGLLRGPTDQGATDRPLDPREFAAVWSPVEVESERRLPDFAATLGGADWLVPVEPAPEQAGPAQRLAIAIGDERVRLRLAIAGVAPGKKMVALKTPIDFEVDSVGPPGGEANGATRWTQPAPGRLVLLLPDALPAASQIEVIGSTPRPAGRFAPPRLAVDAPATGAPGALVYREESVLVEVAPSAAPGVADPVATSGWRVWPVATLLGSPAVEAPLLSVTPNTPVYSAIAATIHTHHRGLITTRWRAQLRVERGKLGEVELALATPNSSSVRLVSPASATLLAAEGSSPASRRVRLAKPIGAGEQVSLEIEVQTGVALEGGIATPPVTLPRAKSVADLVAVPTSVDRATGDDLRWSVIGFRPVEQPDASATLLIPEEGPWRLFEPSTTDQNAGAGRTFWLAKLGPRAQMTCPLVEHQLQAPRGVEAVISSRFAVDPGGEQRCRVTLPVGFVLRTLTIDGADAVSREAEPMVWSVNLQSATLPQLIEVTAVGPRGLDRVSPPVLSTPRQGAIQPRQALWEVADRSGSLISPPAGATRTNAAVASFLRLRAIQPLAASAIDPPPAWLRAWAPRVARLVDEVGRHDSYGVLKLAQRESQGGGSDDDSIAAAYQRARGWVNEVAPSIPLAVAADGPQRDNANEMNEAANAWTYFVAQQPTTRSGPRFEAAVDGGLVTRLMLACVVAALMLATRGRLAAAPLTTLAYDYRHAIAAVGGVAWWLFLQPSVIGLVVLAASVIGQVRGLMRSRRWSLEW